jgi:uncharacterized protein
VSASDIEFLREVYEEWSRGDFSREFFAPDVRYRTTGMVPDDEAQGLDAVIAAQREWLGQWERPFVVDADSFVDAGNVVVALVRWRGRGRGSGVEIEAEGAHLWEIRDDRAVRWEVHRDRDVALAEAGLTADAESGE